MNEPPTIKWRIIQWVFIVAIWPIFAVLLVIELCRLMEPLSRLLDKIMKMRKPKEEE